MEKAPPDHLITHQEEVCLPVRADMAGMRLDMFLKARLSWRSRASVHRLLAQRDVRVSGARRKASYRLKQGELVVVPCPPPEEDPAAMADIELNALHEDEDLVVLNKQPHVVVHPAGQHRYTTLINALHLRYRRPGDPEKDIQPKLGHRLDRETSGVLVVCKSELARRSVSRQFEKGLVAKEYLALAEGEPSTDEGMIDAPLGAAPEGEHAMKRAVRPDGRTARTEYAVAERLGRISLVRVRLLTGRSHQIRVHLMHIGHPILCDKFYGVRETLRLSDLRPLGPGQEDPVLLDRQALHSWRMTIEHPGDRRPVTYEAPLPEDMASVLEAAREGK